MRLLLHRLRQRSARRAIETIIDGDGAESRRNAGTQRDAEQLHPLQLLHARGDVDHDGGVALAGIGPQSVHALDGQDLLLNPIRCAGGLLQRRAARQRQADIDPASVGIPLVAPRIESIAEPREQKNGDGQTR